MFKTLSFLLLLSVGLVAIVVGTIVNVDGIEVQAGGANAAENYIVQEYNENAREESIVDISNEYLAETSETVEPEELEVVGSNDEYAVDYESAELSNAETSEVQASAAPAPEPASIPEINYFAEPITKYATTNLNVRSGPGTNYDRVSGLSFRHSVEIVGESDNWLVTSNGDFIYGRLLTDTQPPVPVTPVAPSASTTTTDAAGRIIRWSTWHANTGEQAQVSACTGGLTLHRSVADFVGYRYFALHRGCGGYRQLRLNVGDYMQIDGVTYQLISERTARSGLSSEVYQFLDTGYDAAIQTTLPEGGGNNRVVGLRRIG